MTLALKSIKMKNLHKNIQLLIIIGGTILLGLTTILSTTKTMEVKTIGLLSTHDVVGYDYTLTGNKIYTVVIGDELVNAFRFDRIAGDTIIMVTTKTMFFGVTVNTSKPSYVVTVPSLYRTYIADKIQ